MGDSTIVLQRVLVPGYTFIENDQAAPSRRKPHRQGRPGTMTAAVRPSPDLRVRTMGSPGRAQEVPRRQDTAARKTGRRTQPLSLPRELSNLLERSPVIKRLLTLSPRDLLDRPTSDDRAGFGRHQIPAGVRLRVIHLYKKPGLGLPGPEAGEGVPAPDLLSLEPD